MAELLRTPGVIGRADGSIEHGVFIRPEPGKRAEVLVHLSVSLSNHASAIDYDSHPACKRDEPAHVLADYARRFLDAGGHHWLGHPSSPASREFEVAKLKAKHGLT
ncbi:MAG: hypothetical protein ACYDCP_09990 [Thermoplasmataceae archaeon]